MRYRTYVIIDLKNYKRKYADKEEILTGFIYHAE